MYAFDVICLQNTLHMRISTSTCIFYSHYFTSYHILAFHKNARDVCAAHPEPPSVRSSIVEAAALYNVSLLGIIIL